MELVKRNPNKNPIKYINLIKYIVRFPFAVFGTIILSIIIFILWLFNLDDDDDEIENMKNLIIKIWKY